METGRIQLAEGDLGNINSDAAEMSGAVGKIVSNADVETYEDVLYSESRMRREESFTAPKEEDESDSSGSTCGGSSDAYYFVPNPGSYCDG